MPRITPLRILNFLVLAWLCMIFAWFFLPSPQIPRALRSSHIQDTLRSGSILTTVLGWDKQTGECAAYAIDWQLVSDGRKDSVSLLVGSAKINLTELAVQAFPPYIGGSVITKVRGGDLNHIINMPWFDYADANLFHHQMHGFPGYLNLRAIVINSKEVQIWKDSKDWDAHDAKHQLINLDDDRRATGLLATFSKIQTTRGARASMSAIEISDLKGRLPSKTYKTRSAMLDILAPTLIVLLFLFATCIAPILWYCLIFICPIIAFYLVFVTFCWWMSGQSNFFAWSKSSSLTMFWYSKGSKKVTAQSVLWGSSGPLVNEDLEEGVYSDGRSRLAMSPWDWRAPSRLRTSTARA